MIATGKYIPVDYQGVHYELCNQRCRDWTHPYASAIYWGREGLAVATKPDHRLALWQIVYQTLMMEARSDSRFAPFAVKALEGAYREFPHPGLRELIGHVRKTYGL